MALNPPNSHTIYGPTCPWVTSPMNVLPRLCEQADRMHLWTRRRRACFCNIIAWSGGRMQDWSIRVCMPETCEVWKRLPGLASIMLQYAWWCTLTSCIYIYIQHSSSHQYLKLRFMLNMVPFWGIFFSWDSIGKKKKSRSSVFLFSSDLSSHSRELLKRSNECS